MNKSVILLYFPILFFMIGCESYNNVKHEPSFVGAIKDNTEWYANENNSVIEINVKIPEVNDFLCAPYNDHTAALRPCTLEDINGDKNPLDDYKPMLHVQIETEDFPASSEAMNAVLKLKGKTTRNSKQKSYRIKLDSKTDLHYLQRTYQLNKHPNDNSRIRNKLSFDFFKEIPNITSSKTQFVNLKINNIDYGLFTHIERTDEYFLKNRKWNENDNLYKAQKFDFRMQSGLAIDSSGKPVNPDAFDLIIEPSVGDDHSKFIEMITAINSVSTDAEYERVFNKYYDRSNYITWMALNIILANKDTVSQNFYLYNPLYSDKFYFLPWDYDGIGRATEKYAKWELGIGTWWDIPLHQKFLKIAKNRVDLENMVDTLREKYITPENIQKKLDKYKKLIRPFMVSLPDSDVIKEEEWKADLDLQVEQIDVNIANYKSQIGVPMPFWQSFTYKNGVLELHWDESIDLEGDKIVYDLYCADNADFNNSIIAETNLDVRKEKLTITSWGEITYKKDIALVSGQRLYMKVIAKEEKNHDSYQIAFEKGVEINDVEYFGVLEFVIE